MAASWFLLAVVTAAIYGAQAAYLKAFTGELDRTLVAWAVFAFGVPVYVAMLALHGVPTVEPRFWVAGAVSLGVNLVAWPMFVRSVQISDVSLVMPLVALTPAFVLLVEFLVLGASPTTWGLAGIALIVLGAYVLNVRVRREAPGGWWAAVSQPIRSLVSDRGAVMMLIVAAMWSVSATVEKITVTSASPAFYLTFLSVGFSLAFLPVLAWKLENPVRQVRTNVIVLTGAGLLTAAMLVAQMQALETTPLVNYVVAIKRAGMLVSVVIGWLWFGEKNIGPRMAGAALMIAGVFLIRIA